VADGELLAPLRPTVRTVQPSCSNRARKYLPMKPEAPANTTVLVLLIFPPVFFR
jgi:hypothetical protein